MTDDPWERAHSAAAAAGVQLRPLTTPVEAREVQRVLAATWGEADLFASEVVIALAESGNVPYGAFAEGSLVGYVLGWAGVDAGGLHLHSHMLAALPDRRHRGVGFALKLAQRAQALDQGLRVARWTFDPMVARNAWFNLGKLGAVADRFRRNFYGQMSDTINAGDRSDRLVVRWDLEREPGPRVPPDDAPRVQVPVEYAELRASDPDAAAAARETVAVDLESAFAEGMIVAGFDRGASAYVLAQEPSA